VIHSTVLRSSKPSSLLMRLSLLLVLAGLLPATSRAQVSYTGASPSVNFGSQAIGTPSAAQTLNFSISAGTTVGSIGVLTQGAANLDFTNAAGSTCTAMTYTSVVTCTVKVILTPKAAGLAAGAVVFFSEASNTGTILANVPVYGIGTGSQIAYGPGTATAIDPTVNGQALYDAPGVAVDAAGDLFIADNVNERVVEVPAGGSAAIAIAPTANGVALLYPSDVKVDGAGDLFIADTNNHRVIEVPVGGGAAIAIDPTANGSGLSDPAALAVDGAGDLFIADYINSRVVEVPSGTGAPTAIDPTVNGLGLNRVIGVTVDGAGDLFIGDSYNNRVVEVPAGGGAPTAIDPTANGTDLNDPFGVAVDGAGDLFIADSPQRRVVEAPAGGGAAIAIAPTPNGVALLYPYNLTVDGVGNLFIADPNNSRVVEIQHSQPPALNFPTVTATGTTDTTDGTQTVQIQNIGNAPLIFTAITYPADFSEASGDANACTSSTSLSPGQECDLPIHFTPHNAGSLSESVTLTDNALGVTGAQQLIGVSGAGYTPTPQTITFAAIAAQRAETSVPLTATASSGLPVSFTSLTPAICTVSASTAFPIAYGTCTIEATQTGNYEYAAAPAVYRSFWVNRAFQTIAFPAIATPQVALTGVALTATASSGLAVTYVSTTPTYCTVSGSIVMPILAIGTCTIEATQPGDSAYNAAAAVFHSFWVNHASQTITFPATASQYVLASLSLTATASSGLAVSYASTTPSICTVSVNTASMIGNGTCTIEATQPGNSDYNPAAAVFHSFWVNAAKQIITFPAIGTQYALTTVPLAATSNYGLTVSFASLTPAICTVSASSASLLVYGTCTIQASQAGNSTYPAAAPVKQSFTVVVGQFGFPQTALAFFLVR
jgi:sugar lactone lactonase YvrE